VLDSKNAHGAADRYLISHYFLICCWLLKGLLSIPLIISHSQNWMKIEGENPNQFDHI
jgi:hypothetical protein